MAQSAAHLVDQVIPRVPVRQWVLSFPIPLRIVFAAPPDLLTPVLRIVHRVITGFLLKEAGLKCATADTGAVTFIQRFGSAANLNIHLHCLVLDGVYRCTGGEPVFQQARAPACDELQGLLDKIIVRLLKLLIRQGTLVEEQGMTYIADRDTDSPLASLQAASCTYRIALGPRAGQKVLSLRTVPGRDEKATAGLCAQAHGFSLHAGVRCGAHQRQELERLCRRDYPFSCRPGPHFCIIFLDYIRIPTFARTTSMRRKKMAHHGAGQKAPSAEAATGSRAWRWIALAAVAGLALAATVAYRTNQSASSPQFAETATPPSGDYVGAKACAACHAKEAEAWRGSHHDLAMQHTGEQSVLGDFGNARFTYAGVISTFFKRDGKFYVNTDGPDGKLRDYEIKYTFGLTPLQQYLVEFPDGRLQALSIAWDARAKTQGGQRWFHLYPGQAIKAGDRLHWTGIDQNWNYQCAECHSTNLRKNFDAGTNTFKTTWSEINVACEACHGPGTSHVAWAKKQGDWQRVPGKGLAIALDERRGVSWNRTEGSETAVRSAPRATSREIEMCARCHARRGQLTDDYVFGRPLADTHRPSLLAEGLYWPDGQQRDEVYNYASFLQSEMFAKGVTCSDCHDPHSGKLRKPGNAVCTQCHQQAHYDAGRHTHHNPGTPGAQCAACHMPTTTYMVLDPRHDHSMRVPRPDRSAAMGVPNACNQCHRNRSAQWAAEQIRNWEPQPEQGHQKFAEALSAGAQTKADARGLLMAVVEDAKQPAIARASALALLARYPGPLTLNILRKTLDDADPLVRGATVEALGAAAPEVRARLLFRMLADPVRLVRIAAARALVSVPAGRASDAERAALARGLEEYIAAQRFNADRPEAHSNLGALYAERGEPDQAEAEFKRALAIDPAFVPAAVNLADLYRARGDEKSAETALRSALKLSPKNASVHHALGLALVRQRRMGEALAELREAARLAPDHARYAYVYGVALHSTGKQAEGIRLLAEAQRRFTGDAGLLQALAAMERDRGNRAAARGYARKLAELTPDDPQAQGLLRELGR